MWRVITLVAVLWPSHVSGLLDGAPLDRLLEAVLLGLVVPALIWLHPNFLRKRAVRVLMASILLIKIVAAFGVQQSGWCVTFMPPYPMVRDSTGKPHSWDLRADWLADDPQCSAIMTRSYRDTFELPTWFYNLPPPDDAVVRTGYSPAEIPVRAGVVGYLTVREPGTFDLLTTPAMEVALRIDGTRVEPKEAAHHSATLARGSHMIQLEGVLLSKEWRIVPQWNGVGMGSMRFPLVTVEPPTRTDRLLLPAAGWLTTLLIAALIATWLVAACARLHMPHLLAWSASASAAVAVVAAHMPQQAPWYTVLVLGLSLVHPIRRRYQSALGVFWLILLPWLAYIAAAAAPMVGRWTLYGIGNDNFLFQRFSYRIFMQHYWLEGGQTTFWNQPFVRWIVGGLHMVFGDSSMGQAYWDAAGVSIIAVFAYRTVAMLRGFVWGLFAALIPLAMFLLGPALEFVGFGLSEIPSASFIYLACFFVLRNRGTRDALIAGVLVTLGFYTRLNNLPMAIAVAAFAVPMTIGAGDWWRVRRWLPLVQWRSVLAVAALLMVGCMLFAWRTWYYTGVFSVFHGTQREFLAVWKPGMSFGDAVPAMVSSLLMVLTGQDPPRLAWHAAPLVAGGVISAAAVAGIRGFRDAPLPVVAMFLAGLSGALITRGWGHEGRFSIHLYGSAASLCAWSIATLTRSMLKSRNIGPSGYRAIGPSGHQAISREATL
jgi:hypothetical protein